MSDTLLFINASEIVTGDLVLKNCAIAVRDGTIVEVGAQAALVGQHRRASIVDCGRQVLTPGLIDSHTHAVFGEWRAAEYEMRTRGLDYMEIARQGGVINSYVRDVRERTQHELLQVAVERLQLALRAGTTTIEIKSGYGLSVEAELKMLHVIRTLADRTPLDIVATFLGAHDVPLDYRNERAAYVQLIIDEMIPVVAANRLATFCDVFMEPGAFTGDEARAILEAGKRHGLVPKLHADEFANSGGAELAAELGAASADHLGAISERGIQALAQSETVATLLPATLFFLGKKRYAPARALLDAGATVALATDFNPGTAPSASMQLVMTMACSQMQMTPLEAITAATRGGARALRLDNVGMLAAGARADIVAWDVDSHVEIPYHFGTSRVAGVWKRGKRVV